MRDSEAKKRGAAQEHGRPVSPADPRNPPILSSRAYPALTAKAGILLTNSHFKIINIATTYGIR
jgi:hypothetical protein